MLIPFAALLLATTCAPNACIAEHPAQHSNTNELVWDRSFDNAVSCFVGDRRADYLYSGGTIADQMIEVLGGPPDPPTRIGELLRFTACRAHSCSEKGAAVIAPYGAIVALAILHTACATRPRPQDCYAHDTLTIFIRDVGDRAVIDNLTAWARNAVAASYHPFGLRAGRHRSDTCLLPPGVTRATALDRGRRYAGLSQETAMKLAAAAALLVSLVIVGAPASAQTRFPRPQADVAMVRTYLGCFIDSGRHLHLGNTTSGVLRVGTPVYWTGKQAGQQEPREYRAPLYAEVAPGGTYQAGGGYRYDPSAGCRVWIQRPPAATLAP